METDKQTYSPPSFARRWANRDRSDSCTNPRDAIYGNFRYPDAVHFDQIFLRHPSLKLTLYLRFRFIFLSAKVAAAILAT